MKNILLSFFGLLIFSIHCFAGQDRNVTVDPVFTEGGNTWIVREVKMSTQGAVILSSVPVNAGLGISRWRKRVIINSSTCSTLGLYPSNTTNTTYDYSDGVSLSSMTTVDPIKTLGNTEYIDHQGEIKGIWKDSEGLADSPATLRSKRGALIYEQYEK